MSTILRQTNILILQVIYIYREYTFLMVIFCFHNSHGDIEWDDFAHMINYNDFIIG